MAARVFQVFYNGLMLHKWLTRIFIILTVLILSGGALYSLRRAHFGFDIYAYAANGLTLYHFSADPFGYDLVRPLLPSLILVPLAAIFYSAEEPLVYLRSLAFTFYMAFPFLIGAINFYLKHLRMRPLTRAITCFVCASSIMLFSSAIGAVSDVLGGLFVFLSIVLYIKSRDKKPRRSWLWFCLFWILASMTRFNYLPFGLLLILIELVCYRIQLTKQYIWFLTSLFFTSLVVVIAIYFSPYIYHYKSDFLSEALHKFLEMRGILSKLASNGFVYHHLLWFSFPSVALIVMLWGGIPSKNQVIDRKIKWILIFYTVFFLVTHLFMVPNQYVRFLIPFLLPMSYLLAKGIEKSFALGKLAQIVFCFIILVASVYPLGKCVSWFGQDFFARGTDVEVARKMSQGDRLIWCGKSFPFVPNKKLAGLPHPSFSTFHFANHTLKVLSGKDTIYVPHVDEEVALANQYGFPVNWLGKLQDKDTIFFNPNQTMFYHGGAREAQPSWVMQVSVKKIQTKGISESFLKSGYVYVPFDSSQGWFLNLNDSQPNWQFLTYSGDSWWGSISKNNQPTNQQAYHVTVTQNETISSLGVWQIR